MVSSREKLEEENWEWYSPATFYSVRIGQVLHSRYQTLGKLGYGTSSTVWLCRDLRYLLRLDSLSDSCLSKRLTIRIKEAQIRSHQGWQV